MVVILFAVIFVLLGVISHLLTKGPEAMTSRVEKADPQASLARAQAPPDSKFSTSRASLVDRYVASTASGAIEAYTRETKESLIVRFRTFNEWSVSAYFDVNQNHRIDPNVDVGYGGPPYDSPNAGGCTFYALTRTSTSTCGGFRSSASVQVQAEPGGWMTTTWVIPKIEVSTSGNSAWMIISAYNSKTAQRLDPSFDNDHTVEIPFVVK